MEVLLRRKGKESVALFAISGVPCCHIQVSEALANLNIFSILGFVIQIAYLPVFLKKMPT